MQIKAEVTITYVYEADSVEEAILLVEEGEIDDCVEVDSSNPRAVEYTIDGQMGWSKIE